jgi:mannose-6-phosphate isomerase-like protein (cupin superfamily)
MIHTAVDRTKPKEWLLGPWDSSVPIPIGYANRGIDEKHFHRQMFEIYLIASGTSTVTVDGREVKVKAGDALVIEPNEVHSFLQSSADYMHFVVHAPFVKDDKVLVN